MNGSAFAADAVVVVHLAFIAFVVAGGFLALRWHWLPLLHLPALGWGIWIELSGGICPLTPLENRLRTRAGETGYGGGFVDHYLIPILYPQGLTSGVQALLASALILVNVVAYVQYARGRKRRQDSDRPSR